MLSVSLLGEARLAQDGVAFACSSKKSLALFVHLLLAEGRSTRRELARLLWGGAEATARTSLRTALQRLPPPLAQQLAIDRDHVALLEGAARDLDTTRFGALAAADDIDSLEQAADLYGGELLHGFEADATPEFDDWLHRERARWRQLAQSVFDRLIARHRERAHEDSAHAAAQREAAMATARRWLALEPAAEAAHRWLIQLYIDIGLLEAALAQYEVCRRELAVGAGRVPGEQTRSLIDTLAAATGVPQATWPEPGAEPRFSTPPLATTSFVGRLAELAAIDEMLGDPACRLITLHGLGGSGKSRLAAVVARQAAARMPHGASWVTIDATTPSLAKAIAQALGVEPPGAQDPARALAAALRGQERLLVLDNLEVLLEPPGGSEGRVGVESNAIELVLTLLREAPRLRLLVTSRDVLGVQEEWVLELGGLPCPDDEDAAAPPPALETWPAVELFVQRARQAHRGFSLAAEWPHVLRLCRSVEGLPLALELAAAWVRTVPCAELARTVQAEASGLSSLQHNRPARQASLDTVVRSTWQWLAPEQQSALAAMSVFAGSFTHEAAAEVAGAALRTVSALIDKSLVARQADGRLALHPIVRQFAHARLEASGGAQRQAGQRHAAFFAHRLRHWRARFNGPDELEADFALADELPDMRLGARAWHADGSMALLAEPWLRALQTRGLHREVQAEADAILAADPGESGAECGMVLVLRAASLAMLGQIDSSRAGFAAAEAKGRALQRPDVLAQALVHGITPMLGTEQFDAALAQLESAQDAVKAAANPALDFAALHYRGLLHYGAGRLTEAEAVLRQALAMAGHIGSPRMSALARTSLATVLVRLGQAAEAQALLQQARPFYERSGNQQFLARVCNVLACSWMMDDDPARADAATESARQAVRLYERCGVVVPALSARHTLGRAHWLAGRTDEARSCFEAAAATSFLTLAGEGRASLVRLEVAAGDLDAARGHARLLAKLVADTGHVVARRCLLLAGTVLGAAQLRQTGEAIESELGRWVLGWRDALLADPDVDADMRRALLATGLPLEPTPEPPANAAQNLIDAIERLGRWLQD